MDVLSPVPLSVTAYETLAALVYRHSRIRLGADKQAMLANRLGKRLRTLGLDSYEAYCALLHSPAGPEEIEHLVDLISTNHTRFFREPEHFNFLTDVILPILTPDLLRQQTPLRCWSAAASSGEEPYTLAIVLTEYGQRHTPSFEWRIDASDISRRMLSRARQGIYRLDPDPPVPIELIKRYFQRGVGERAGTCRVKPELRRCVQFHHVNLFQAEYPVPRGQHVIFCRNVMIYFDPPSRATVVDKLTRHLAPGGYLFIGHSESLLGLRHDLNSLGHGIYRRP